MRSFIAAISIQICPKKVNDKENGHICSVILKYPALLPLFRRFADLAVLVFCPFPFTFFFFQKTLEFAEMIQNGETAKQRNGGTSIISEQ